MNKKDTITLRWVMYMACFSLFFTDYYNVGSILLIISIGITTPKNDFKKEDLLIYKNIACATFAFVYYIVVSIGILNYSEVFFNLPFALLLGIVFVPFIPDILLFEINIYKKSTSQ